MPPLSYARPLACAFAALSPRHRPTLRPGGHTDPYACGFALLLPLLLWLIGCTDRPAAPPIDAPPRIVCLAPTLTAMLADLGEMDRIVAVAQYDTLAPPNLPVVGNYLDVDIERLLSVQPTLVLTMAGKEGVPPRLRQLADAGYFKLRAWDNPDPMRLEHVTRMLLEVGEAVGRADEAARQRDRILAELEQVRQQVQGLEKPRALLVIGTHPVMACGPGTAHDQMLQLAGAVNAAAAATVTAPTFDREALIAMQPQVILILRPGEAPLSGEDDERMAGLRGLPIPAVRDGRVIVLNDPLVLLPSSSMARVVRAMAAAIHPQQEWADVP